MTLKQNPRPNFHFVRTCGNCKFFINTPPANRYGRCVLPRITELDKETKKDIKNHLKEFAPTYVYFSCDNHQWKKISFFRRAAKHAGVGLNDIR